MQERCSLDDPMVSSGHEDDPSNKLYDGEANRGASDNVAESDEGTMNLDVLVSEAEKYLKE